MGKHNKNKARQQRPTETISHDWGEISAYQDQIHSAVSALKNLNNNDLWADDGFVHLCFGLQKVVDISKTFRATLFDVPHQILPDKTDVCLFVRDGCPPQLLSDLKARLGKVITLHKLCTNYNDYEQKRQLSNRYDLYLYDKHIHAHVLPYRLGEHFLQKKKNVL